MNTKKYNLFHRIIQKFASSRPGGWFLSRTLPHLDRAALRLTGGRSTLTSILAGIPMVTVTMVGAKSGQPRTIPLLCVTDETMPGSFALVASNWGQEHSPGWYYNLKKNPRAECTLRGHVGIYLAHEAAGEEYNRFWQLAANTYFGFTLYKQRASHRHIPIMVMVKEK